MSSLTSQLAGMPETQRITKGETKAMLGSPELVLVDVRKQQAWESSDSKIQSAVRHDPSDILSWSSQYPFDKTLVFYCS